LRRELAGYLPDHCEPAEQMIIAEKRYREQGPVSSTHKSTPHSALGRRGPDVRHFDRPRHLRQLSGGAFPFADRWCEHRVHDLDLELLGRPWCEDLALIIVLVNDPGVGPRELRRPRYDRSQHRLEIQC